jgi:hypothetical protein
VGTFVEDSLKRLGVRQQVHKVGLEEWCRRWLGEAGGRALVRVTVKKGVVTWEFRHGAWRQEVLTRQEEALRGLQQAFPGEGYRRLETVLARN